MVPKPGNQMVRPASSFVDRKNQEPVEIHQLFGALGEHCPCGCGGRTFLWDRGAPLKVCFSTSHHVQELIHRVPLQATQKSLLQILLFHARNGQECWPSELRLLAALGLRSRQTLNTHKKALRALGILDWLPPGHPANPHPSALYRLSWTALQALVEAQVQARPSKAYPRRPLRLVPDVANEPEAPGESALRENSGKNEPAAPTLLEEDPQGAPTPSEEDSPATPTLLEENEPASPASGEPMPTSAEDINGRGQEPPPPLGSTDDLSFVLDEALREHLPVVASAELDDAYVAASVELDDVPVVASAAREGASIVASAEPEGFSSEPGCALAVASTQLDSVGELPANEVEGSTSLPEPSSCEPVSPALAPVRRGPEPSASFEVPLCTVWNLWGEAYLRVYGQPYVQTGADRKAAREIAVACVAAVLHYEQRTGAAPGERLPRAQAYLEHVFRAFLKRTGRNDFLRSRRHPLSAMPEDLNALGDPWSSARAVVAKPAPLPPPPPLPREEQLAWCKKARAALDSPRTVVRPRITRGG
jgi:hypothetical protein